MSEIPLGGIGDPEILWDRVVLRTFAIVFPLAEVMLVVGAFQYAGNKVDSPLLISIAWVLSIVGAAWLGLILPSTVGKLQFWTRVGTTTRRALAGFVVLLSLWLTIGYLEVVKSLANSQLLDVPSAVCPDLASDRPNLTP